MMNGERFYATPDPTVPPQTAMVTSRVVLKPRYAIIPASVLVNITTSNLPYWQRTRCWVLATPAIGYGTTFTEYLLYVEAGGGSEEPESEEGVESFLFVCDGEIELRAPGRCYQIEKGGFAFLPPDQKWSIRNEGRNLAKFLWVRKRYEPIRDLKPDLFVGNERDVPEISIEGFGETGRSQSLFPRDNMAYDMAVNLNNWDPGCVIPVAETHVMEHGLYMLQGKGVYLLNDEWYEVKEGDFIWMAPFCPQSFYCGGPSSARYLLYKNVNRQFSLRK